MNVVLDFSSKKELITKTYHRHGPLLKLIIELVFPHI